MNTGFSEGGLVCLSKKEKKLGMFHDGGEEMEGVDGTWRE